MMAEILTPGVRVNEVQTGNAPIAGVGTSVAGFVGYAKRGEVGKPVLVTSWTDYKNKFSYGLDSPYLENANLAYSIFGFFQNGGTMAYVSRAVSETATKARATITTTDTSEEVLLVEALEQGNFGNDVEFSLSTVTGGYDFIVKFKGEVVGEYLSVSLDSQDDNFIEYAVNGVDRYVSVTATGTSPSDSTTETSLSGGNDGILDADDTDLANAFNAFDSVDINILVCPESQSNTVNQAGLAYAESKLAFYVMDGLLDATIESIQEERDQYGSGYGGLYFPWIEVADPIAKGVKKARFVPVGGHVAGIMARVDGLRGVFKAPAGLDSTVRGALDVKTVVTDETQGLLNPKGINAIRPMAGAGIVVWGARTTSPNPADRYVNVRRSLLYLRASLKLGTRWAVFEPNDEVLWKKLTTSARGFLLGEYRNGMFKGTSPDQAFFVKCDAELNPQSEIDAGRVNMQIGVAINKPGEFIIINIGQWAGGQE